jgi:hypothetical protein
MKQHPAKYSAFISYASDDREKADDICAALEDRDFMCWIAPRNVRAGREYADEIIAGIEQSACVVLVLSEATNSSVFVRREVERAVSKNKPIFPVRIAEVLPSPGLELFVSGTHWLDAWDGDWDDHMALLAREVASVQPGKALTEVAAGRLPLSDGRGVRGVYVAAAVVLAAGLGGAGFWAAAEWGSTPALSDGVSPPPVSGTDNPRDEPGGSRGQASRADAPPPAQDPPVETDVELPARVDSTRDRQPNPQVTPRGREAPPRGRQGQTEEREAATSRPQVMNPPPPVRAAVEPAPRVLAASAELNELRDELDDLTNRGETIDDTLNRLWDDMRPLAPRVDMATRQRSLRTALARSREALAEKNAADARRYMDNVRADLAALEQFLGR